MREDSERFFVHVGKSGLTQHPEKPYPGRLFLGLVTSSLRRPVGDFAAKSWAQ
jgi:hypothetical protein